MFNNGLKKFAVSSLVWGKGIRVKKAVSASDLERVYQFRWRTYLREGYIEKSDYPKGLLSDKYDLVATNFFAEKNGKVVGVLRLVLYSKMGFPTENAFNISTNIPQRPKTAEVSKLSVEPTSKGKLISFGLLSNALKFSLKNDIDYWLFGITDKLKKHFESMGVKFTELKAGKLRELHLAERKTAKKYFDRSTIKPFLLEIRKIERQ